MSTSKTIEITKDDILDALEDEPLKAGSWLSEDGCRACAVGSVLRGKLPALAEEQLAGPYYLLDALAGRLTGNCYTAENIAPIGNWLSALSIRWESLNGWNEGLREEEARDLILDWADENIPDDYVALIEVGA